MPKPRQKARVGNHTGDYSAALSTEKRLRGSETAYKSLREKKDERRAQKDKDQRQMTGKKSSERVDESP